METTCAVCRLSDGLVMNIIMASPSDLPPNGCQLVEIMTGQACNIGWFYVNDTFNGPTTYAMCDDVENEVVSLLTVSFVSPVPVAAEGYYSVEVPIGAECDIGWTWDGVSFIPPVA